MAGAQGAHDDVDAVGELRAELLLPAGLRRNFSTRNGSTTPANSVAPAACDELPSNVMVAPKAAIMPMTMNKMSLPKPMLRPDCSTSRLRLTSGSR